MRKTPYKALKIRAKATEFSDMSDQIIDPTCLMHGKKWSEHTCLYCCICYNPNLKPEDCYEDEGGKWDMCKSCGPKAKPIV